MNRLNLSICGALWTTTPPTSLANQHMGALGYLEPEAAANNIPHFLIDIAG